MCKTIIIFCMFVFYFDIKMKTTHADYVDHFNHTSREFAANRDKCDKNQLFFTPFELYIDRSFVAEFDKYTAVTHNHTDPPTNNQQSHVSSGLKILLFRTIVVTIIKLVVVLTYVCLICLCIWCGECNECDEYIEYDQYDEYAEHYRHFSAVQ